MTNAATPVAVAVVGAGPSGLFAAQALLAADPEVRVDVFDRLPTPYGLVRYGVAPDHASMKAVVRVFDTVLADPRVTFYGLVELGRDVAAPELVAAYDAVVYATGATDDTRLGIPGEALSGSGSARQFVAWYSGHPDADTVDLRGVGEVVTFGVGNVAADVARILLRDRAALSATDMPEAVLAELRAAEVADVWVIGRRGPEHAAFTTPELRELLSLDGVQPVVNPADLPDGEDPGWDRRTRGNVEALRAASERVVPAPRARLHLRFWTRPVEYLGAERLAGVRVERTAPDADGRLVGTGETAVIGAQLALRAIGYRAKPLPGVPFDAARGVVANVEGRVTDADATPRPGEYVTGWLKRGPVGVIGSNKSDAAETVRHLMADLAASPARPTRPGLGELLASRGVRPSTYADWQRIDAAEQALGASRARARTKVETWEGLTGLVDR